MSLSLKKDRNVQIKHAQRTSSRININNPIPRHIMVKPLKTKDRMANLQSIKKKTVIHSSPGKIIYQLSFHQKPCRKGEKSNISKVLKEKYQLRFHNQRKYPFKNESKIKVFLDELKVSSPARLQYTKGNFLG